MACSREMGPKQSRTEATETHSSYRTSQHYPTQRSSLAPPLPLHLPRTIHMHLLPCVFYSTRVCAHLCMHACSVYVLLLVPLRIGAHIQRERSRERERERKPPNESFVQLVTEPEKRDTARRPCLCMGVYGPIIVSVWLHNRCVAS